MSGRKKHVLRLTEGKFKDVNFGNVNWLKNDNEWTVAKDAADITAEKINKWKDDGIRYVISLDANWVVSSTQDANSLIPCPPLCPRTASPRAPCSSTHARVGCLQVDKSSIESFATTRAFQKQRSLAVNVEKSYGVADVSASMMVTAKESGSIAKSLVVR